MSVVDIRQAVADAREAGEFVADAQVREVGEVERVVGLVGGVEVHDHRQRRRRLHGRDAERAHRGG